MSWKKTYNVNELQQKNKEIIAQNQEAMSQTVQENVPATTLNQAGVSVGGVEEQNGETWESTVA